jgi:hypothetical protein
VCYRAEVRIIRRLIGRVDEQLHAIKGGGACQLREKVLAEAATTWVIVADYRKNSKALGSTVSRSTLSAQGAPAYPVVDTGYPHRSGSLCVCNGAYQPFPYGLSRYIGERETGTGAPHGRQEGWAGRQRQRKLYHRRAVRRGLDEETRRGKLRILSINQADRRSYCGT